MKFNCLEATQLENKVNHLERNKIDVCRIKKDSTEFIKDNKLILKTQESERHNVFTEKINKIALSSNDDKKIQSVDLIEAYAYGTSKDLISEKEEIKCNNIKKQYKNG